MDILTYINRMNQIYGNDTQVARITDAPFMAPELQEDISPTPNIQDLLREEGIEVGEQVKAPVRYNTQQYLQGGRVGYKPGGIVEPGVTHYAKTELTVLKEKLAGITKSRNTMDQVSGLLDEIYHEFKKVNKRPPTLKEWKTAAGTDVSPINNLRNKGGYPLGKNVENLATGQKTRIEKIQAGIKTGIQKDGTIKYADKATKNNIKTILTEWGNLPKNTAESAAYGGQQEVLKRLRAASPELASLGDGALEKFIVGANKDLNIKKVVQTKSATLARPNASSVEENILRDLTEHIRQRGNEFKYVPGSNKTTYGQLKIIDNKTGDILTKDSIKKFIAADDLRFREYKKVFDQVAKIKNTPYTHPITGVKTTLGKALSDHFGHSVIHLQHEFGKVKSPLKNLSAATWKQNMAAKMPLSEEGTKLFGVRKEGMGPEINPDKFTDDLRKFADRRILQTEASGFVKPKTPKQTLAKIIEQGPDGIKFLFQPFCGYTRSAGGRIGFNKGSCPTNVAQRNFLMATNDVAKGRVTGKAAEQIAKNAGKVVAKAGSKSALMSILGPAGFGLDIAFEIGSIGTDMAMDSNVTLKGALQNNWLTGFFMKGTGQEEYHKGVYKNYPEAKPLGMAMDLYARIEQEEKNLKRMKTGSDRATATEEMLNAQKQKIADLSSFFDKLARKEGGRYLALEEGSPEQVAYQRATQEYDSIGAARTSQGQDKGIDITSSIDQTMIPEKEILGKYTSKAKGPTLLKRTSKAGFERMIKEGAQKRGYSKLAYGYEESEQDKKNKADIFGFMPRKEYEKYQKDYDELKNIPYEDIPKFASYTEFLKLKPEGSDKTYGEIYPTPASRYGFDLMGDIAREGGIANMAAGGRVPFKFGGIDKGRRAFMKWLAGITGAAVAGGTGLIKLGGKTATKVAPQVTEEVIKRGADGMPTYIADLIKVVKAKGVKKIMDSNINKYPDTVHSYKGVEVIDEVGGTTRIKRPTEGVATDSSTGKMHDGISKEVEMEIRPSDRDVYTDPESGMSWYIDEGKGRRVYETKPPDEYLEGTVRPDEGGKMTEVDEFIDDADHLELKKIADEGTYDTSLPDIDDID